MTETTQELPQEQEEWVKQQYQSAMKYLAEKGIVTQQVAVEKSRYIAPLVSIWHMSDDNNKGYWVISGDVPCDHVSLESAPGPRDVLRHFALKWQLQADRLIKSADEQPQKFGKELIQKAESLYRLYEAEDLWQ